MRFKVEYICQGEYVFHEAATRKRGVIRLTEQNMVLMVACFWCGAVT